MRLFGLIGYPLGHSFSASFFAKKFDSNSSAPCSMNAVNLMIYKHLIYLNRGNILPLASHHNSRISKLLPLMSWRSAWTFLEDFVKSA